MVSKQKEWSSRFFSIILYSLQIQDTKLYSYNASCRNV